MNLQCQPCPLFFHRFEPVSLTFQEEVVGSLKPSGSPNDPLPPRLFKEVFSAVAPYVLEIVNTSLISGCVPKSLKRAVVQPLLKKASLDINIMSNFRPISKLAFTSKLLEKIVYHQLKAFLEENAVLRVFQSGFKSSHSTETALLRVFNDILQATDCGHSVILVLLDLTAAFDTVDHQILLTRLERCVGIQGTALEWLRSYLTDREICVRIGSSQSAVSPLNCGVPQGSILGPLLFPLYLLPLGTIFRNHGIAFHLYADDTQLYMPLKHENGNNVKQLLDCVEEVRNWLSLNLLFLNDSKTEMTVFEPSSRNSAQDDFGALSQYFKPVITNLGVKFDSTLKLAGAG